MNAEEKEMMEASEKAHKEIDAILQKYIGRMFGSLEAASIKYFLETGRINGSFRLNLVRMMSDYAHQLRESAATPPDVEQMAEEVLRRKLNEHSFNYYNRLGAEYLKVLKSAMIAMYQAGQSAVQDATPEHDLPTNIPDGDGDWSINQETFTRGEVFKILFTQRAMITNDLKTSCWDELPETAKNIILNPRKPKI